MLNKILYTIFFFVFSWARVIAQEVKNYNGDLYLNCSWLEGTYLSPNGTAFGNVQTYFTNHVVHVSDLKNGIKIDSTKKELIGILFQYAIALKDTSMNILNEPEKLHKEDSILYHSTEYTYWRDPNTGIITRESYAPYSIYIKKISNKKLSYELHSYQIITDVYGNKTKITNPILEGEIRLKTKNKSAYKKRNWRHDRKLVYKLIRDY